MSFYLKKKKNLRLGTQNMFGLWPSHGGDTTNYNRFVDEFFRKYCNLHVDQDLSGSCIYIVPVSNNIRLVINENNLLNFDFTIALYFWSACIEYVCRRVLPVDVFPAYSSTARGIAVTGNNIGSTMSATLMGYMVSNHVNNFIFYFFLFV